MEERFVTSEEKLLKVIRKQDKVKASVKSRAQKTAGNSLRNDSTVGLLKFCNRLFLFISVCFVVFLGYKYFQLKDSQPVLSRVENNVTPNVPEGSVSITTFAEDLFPTLPEVSVSRDIFEAPWEKPQIEEKADLTAPNMGAELKAVIRLAGIILDKNNPQIIVEDITTGETVFLNEGQEYKSATLVRIEETKAVFLYQDQNVELTP